MESDIKIELRRAYLILRLPSPNPAKPMPMSMSEVGSGYDDFYSLMYAIGGEYLRHNFSRPHCTFSSRTPYKILRERLQ